MAHSATSIAVCSSSDSEVLFVLALRSSLREKNHVRFKSNSIQKLFKASIRILESIFPPNITLSSNMERDGDLLLNVSCSHKQANEKSSNLPLRMPDGTKIENKRNLIKKIHKTHTSVSNVFIPNHKLPVLDEFGLIKPKDQDNSGSLQKLLPSLSERESNVNKKSSVPRDFHGQTQKETDDGALSHKTKRKKRKKREEEPKIIPKEVQAVANGLPPSFPMHKIKKFTEEYQMKKRKRMEEEELNEDESQNKSKRRSFVPGLNPRKREKGAHVFTDMTLKDLDDLHPYLASNLEQNFDIKNLTKVQSTVIPELLKTRFNSTLMEPRLEFLINSGVGTGKILSYVIPIVNNLALLEPKIDRTSGIHALVLVPTRELAAKVNDIFVKLCRSFLWIVPGILTGGERKKSEKARLRKGLNILITTPGRLIDHVEHSRSMDFVKMRYCIMADVHRLLDPERAEVAKKLAIILRKMLPKGCVKCIVTATMTKKIEKLVGIVVSKPKVIDAFKQFE